MITEIIPNLWLSNYNTIKNQNNNFIEEKNIKLIINCSKNIPFKKNMKKDEIKLIRYEIEDGSPINYSKTFKINKMIFNYLSKNKGIICYCYEGTQCSPMLIITYLIQYSKIDSKQIIKSVQSKNNLIFKPINNFETYLEKYRYNIFNHN
tara:strand:+ start:125 stop:574 length:450 start_codon:yes stop_codon:yes gene_type:complete